MIKTSSLIAALLIAAPAGEAQRLANWRPYIAVGRDVEVVDRNDATRAVFAMAGFAWQQPYGDAGLRVYALFNKWNSGSDDPYQYGCDDRCQFEGYWLGFGFDGTRDIVDLGEGKLRPFLLGGGSVMGALDSFQHDNCPYDDPTDVSSSCTIRNNGFGFGLHGGAGFAMRAGSRTLTLEGRFEIRLNDLPGSAQVGFPILLGIRF